MNKLVEYLKGLTRAAAVALVPVIVVAFASMTGPARADHDADHVDDLKGRIGDIERKIWDCENNTGACVTDTNAATICSPGLVLDGSGACVAVPVADTLEVLRSVCTQGQTVIFDETDGWVCS